MALLRAIWLREYRTRLDYWRRELERMEPADAQKLAEARAYVHEYERMIADLERSEREQQEIRSDNEAI